MGKLLNIVTPLHLVTERNYLERMLDDKILCMKIAKQYEEEYWDGERRYGYGGYRYIPGYWKPVAEKLILEYGLTNQSSVLDIGCGKAFLLHELRLLLPDLKVCGIDVSKHGLNNVLKGMEDNVFLQSAKVPLPFKDKEFDLVISINTFHNFKIFELETALSEMQRVGKRAFLLVESYRNEKEFFNLQCWALTAESFFDVPEWTWIYEHFGYTGDYEFIFFE